MVNVYDINQTRLVKIKSKFKKLYRLSAASLISGDGAGIISVFPGCLIQTTGAAILDGLRLLKYCANHT